MTLHNPPTALPEVLTARIDRALADFLRNYSLTQAGIPTPPQVVDTLVDFVLVGGKRLRPTFEVLTDTRALSRVEQMIRDRSDQAHAALDAAPFPEEVTAALRQLADAAATRRS